MQGIFHAYYTVALAPAIGALVGMGVGEAWERRRHRVGAARCSPWPVRSTAVWAFVAAARARPEYGVVAADRRARRRDWPRRCAARSLAGPAAPPGGRARSPSARGLLAALAGPAGYCAARRGATGAHRLDPVTAGPASGGGRGGDGRVAAVPAAMPGGRRAGGVARRRHRTPGPAAPGRRHRRWHRRQPAGAGGGMGGLLDATYPERRAGRGAPADAGPYTWVAAAVGSKNAAGLPAGHRAAGDGDRRLQRQSTRQPDARRSSSSTSPRARSTTSSAAAGSAARTAAAELEQEIASWVAGDLHGRDDRRARPSTT